MGLRLGPRPLAVHLVGSWSRPAWLSSPSLVDALASPDEFWRPAAAHRQQAQDDATRLAILDQVRAGVDLVTDGEQRRQMFDQYFYARLGGVDAAHRVPHRWGGPRTKPRDESWRQVAVGNGGGVSPELPSPQVVGPIEWPGPLAASDFDFLQRELQGHRLGKMAISGPITAMNRLADAYYHDPVALGWALAKSLNAEAHALADAGCRFLQLDEPEFRSAHLEFPDLARDVINETVRGLRERGVTTFAHMCYGYANAVTSKRVNPEFYGALELLAATDIDAISLEYTQPGHQPDVLAAVGDKGVALGAINCDPASRVETPGEVAARLEGALTVVPAERLHASTDCGLWFLPRTVAAAKLASLVDGTRIVRRSLHLD